MNNQEAVGGGGRSWFKKATFSAESTKSVTSKDNGTERKTQELLCPIEKPQQAAHGFRALEMYLV